MKLFVTNLPFKLGEEDLRELFSRCSTLTDVKLIKHRETGKSKGYAFLEISDIDEAQQAIQDLHQKEVEGREIIVQVAEERPRKEGHYGDRRSGGKFNKRDGGHRGGGSYHKRDRHDNNY